VKVKDVMTSAVVTVGPETPLKEVAGRLVRHRISGVPVVDRRGHPLGVVSETDILHKEVDPELEETGIFWRLLHRGRLAREKHEARTAREAMTSPPVMIRPDAPLSIAARKMVELQLDRLVVVDDGQIVGEIEDGKVAGIVTGGDIVRAFARSDQELERELHDIIDNQFWIPPGQVRASVKSGHVKLVGQVDVEGTAESLTEALRRVPGVVGVESNLSWQIDKRRLERSVSASSVYTGGRQDTHWPN
jgi:CBS domain-containing protein